VKFPHPLALLTGCIALAAALTWVLPAGQYERRHDDATGREVVVPGTWHPVPAAPVSPFDAVVAIPRGMIAAADVIFLVLLVGGAFVVVDKTGALGQAMGWLAGRLGSRPMLVIPVVSLCFATGGAVENMGEEIIALIPILLLLARRLGFTPVIAVAMSLGAAAVGASFSPLNPFQSGIAQKLAHLPLGSGWLFRSLFLAAALGLWIAGTMRYARRNRVANDSRLPTPEEAAPAPLSARSAFILIMVLAAFGTYVYGALRLGWELNQLSALFFAMGVAAGLIGGLGVQGTAGAFAEGFASMAYAAVLIGFARAISVLLDQGHVIDTVVHGMLVPIEGRPPGVAALAMMVAHTGIHFPVPSVSGQAVLTMPVLVPLSDLVGLSRQVTVLAYQYGAGLAELLTPTNGALMAVIAAAGVPYDRWLKFATPLMLLLLALGGAAILSAIAIGLT
jgi:uncharacterized ion transporter superfamily protein YfcC